MLKIWGLSNMTTTYLSPIIIFFDEILRFQHYKQKIGPLKRPEELTNQKSKVFTINYLWPQIIDSYGFSLIKS